MAFPITARFAHPGNGYKGDQDQAAEHLTAGKVYALTGIDVGRSSSRLFLDIPDGPQSGFNTVMFDPASVFDEDDEDEPKPITRHALVEQMGHRATTGTVRETTFLGEPMLEVTDLLSGRVHLVSPKSLYEVTWLTEAEARQQVKPWTAVAIQSAGDQDDDDPWPGDDDEPAP